MEGRPRTSDEATKTCSFSCWPSLWREIAETAEAEGKSISELIRELLKDALAQRRKRHRR